MNESHCLVPIVHISTKQDRTAFPIKLFVTAFSPLMVESCYHEPPEVD